MIRVTSHGEDLADALTRGYGLDGGGYEFEGYAPGQPGHPLSGCAKWEDPNDDYLGWGLPLEARLGGIILARNIGEGGLKWPESLPYDTNDRLWLVEAGVTTGGSSTCHCLGHVAYADSGLEGVDLPLGDVLRWITELGWEWPSSTGYVPAKGELLWVYGDGHHGPGGHAAEPIPRPDCQSCRGEGYLEQPAVEWALYALREEG